MPAILPLEQKQSLKAQEALSPGAICSTAPGRLPAHVARSWPYHLSLPLLPSSCRECHFAGLQASVPGSQPSHRNVAGMVSRDTRERGPGKTMLHQPPAASTSLAAGESSVLAPTSVLLCWVSRCSCSVPCSLHSLLHREQGGAQECPKATKLFYLKAFGDTHLSLGIGESRDYKKVLGRNVNSYVYLQKLLQSWPSPMPDEG